MCLHELGTEQKIAESVPYSLQEGGSRSDAGSLKAQVGGPETQALVELSRRCPLGRKVCRELAAKSKVTVREGRFSHWNCQKAMRLIKPTSFAHRRSCARHSLLTLHLHRPVRRLTRLNRSATTPSLPLKRKNHHSRRYGAIFSTMPTTTRPALLLPLRQPRHLLRSRLLPRLR